MSIPNVGGAPQPPEQGNPPKKAPIPASKEAEVFKKVHDGSQDRPPVPNFNPVRMRRPPEPEAKAEAEEIREEERNLAQEIDGFFTIRGLEPILGDSDLSVKFYALDYSLINLEEDGKLEDFCKFLNESLGENSKILQIEFDDGYIAFVIRHDEEGFLMLGSDQVTFIDKTDLGYQIGDIEDITQKHIQHLLRVLKE